MLPDDALLAIFEHYMDDVRYKEGNQTVERAWQSLVHVCRRWRCIVFESPRRLDLWLVCTGLTPARDRLDVWPALPLIILGNGDFSTESGRYVDNIVAALERSDRVSKIDIANFRSSDVQTFLAAMQQPFPELTNLRLWSYSETVVVSDSFLASSPGLLSLSLSGIPFPGLPKLLLSATHLQSLQLHFIPHSGYFTPDAIATVLSSMTSLDFLLLTFLSPRSCPDLASQRPPLSARSVVPVLTTFDFKGASEYLEDLVARIDAPKLGRLEIVFFNDIVFDTPQLIRFISHTPNSKALQKAHINLRDSVSSVDFTSLTSPFPDLIVKILCKGLDWQLSSLAQICTSCLPPLSMLEDLYFHEDSGSQLDWQDSIDNDLWLELLRPFSAVKNLHLAEKVASRVALALQELVEGRTTEVLPMVMPNLQNIIVGGPESSGPVQEGIGQFVAARLAAGHPIAVSRGTNG